MQRGAATPRGTSHGRGALHSLRRQLRKRSSRRTIISCCLAMLALEVGLGLVKRWHELAASELVTFMMAAWILVFSWLASTTTFRIELKRPESEYDERERALRDRAFRTSYIILGSIAMLYLLVHLGNYESAAYFWSRYLSLLPDVARVLWWQGFLSVGLLPAAVLAWIEPDPPED
jgi:hypothetical protein